MIWRRRIRKISSIGSAEHRARHQLAVVGAEAELEGGEADLHVEQELVVRDQQRPDEGRPGLDEGEDADGAQRRHRERGDHAGQDPPLGCAIDTRRLEQLGRDRRATCWRKRKMPKLMNR